MIVPGEYRPLASSVSRTDNTVWPLPSVTWYAEILLCNSNYLFHFTYLITCSKHLLWIKCETDKIFTNIIFTSIVTVRLVLRGGLPLSVATIVTLYELCVSKSSDLVATRESPINLSALESGDWSLIASDTLACPLACKRVERWNKGIFQWNTKQEFNEKNGKKITGYKFATTRSFLLVNLGNRLISIY